MYAESHGLPVRRTIYSHYVIDDRHLRSPEMQQRRHGRDGGAVNEVAIVIQDKDVDVYRPNLGK